MTHTEFIHTAVDYINKQLERDNNIYKLCSYEDEFDVVAIETIKSIMKSTAIYMFIAEENPIGDFGSTELDDNQQIKIVEYLESKLSNNKTRLQVLQEIIEYCIHDAKVRYLNQNLK